MDNAREPIAARIQRVDEDHANPKRVWREMGQPEYLSRKDVERLEEASHVVSEKQTFSYRDGSVFLRVSLPAHAIAAITVEFKPR